MGRTLKSLLAAAAALLVLPAAAGASATLSPTGHDFGTLTLGTAATKAFQLVTVCDDDEGLIGYQCKPLGDPPLDVAIAVTGGFTQTNDCPAVMPRSTPAAACTIWISYSPTAVGGASGVVSTGDAGDGAPSSWLTGTAVAPAPKSAKKKKRCRKAKKAAKCLKRKRVR